MLQNAYFLAKIGADTAKNERNFAKNLPKIGKYPTGPLPGRGGVEGGVVPGESAGLRERRLALRRERLRIRAECSAFFLNNVVLSSRVLRFFAEFVDKIAKQ